MNFEYSAASFAYAVIDYISEGGEHSDDALYYFQQIQRYIIWPLNDLYNACIITYLAYN